MVRPARAGGEPGPRGSMLGLVAERVGGVDDAVRDLPLFLENVDRFLAGRRPRGVADKRRGY
jgi:hypothetical protein